MPMVLGHEAAGEVVEIGAGVDGLRARRPRRAGLRPGLRRLRPVPRRPRRAVRAGRRRQRRRHAAERRAPARDRDGRSTTTSASRAFADHVVVSARSAVTVDPELPFEIAALFGCAVLTGVGRGASTARTSRPARASPSSAWAASASRRCSARGSPARGTIVARRRRARRSSSWPASSARRTPSPAGPDAVERDPRGRPAAGPTTSSRPSAAPRVLAEAYAATRRGGTTVTVGLPAPRAACSSIPAVCLVAEERTLKGSYLGSCVPARDIPRFVALHRQGRLPVERLLTHRLDARRAQRGLRPARRAARPCARP